MLLRVVRTDQFGCSGGISTFMEQVNEKLTKDVLKYVHMLVSFHIFLPDCWSYGGGPLLDTSLWLAATASDVCSSQIIVHWIIESRWHRKFSFLLWRYSGGHSVHVALHGADEEAQTSLYSSHTRSISVYKCDANSVRGNRSCNGSGPSSKTQSTYLCVVLLFETLQCTLLTHLSTLEVEEKQAERLVSSKQERKTAS